MNQISQSRGNGRFIKLHFQRFEFKYLIDQATKEEIKQFISPFVVVDKYAEDTGNGSYQVISLYYDSPLFYYYHEKVDGVKKRKKIRLRVYRNNGQLSNNYFFEIKRKHDSVVLKDRIPFEINKYDDFVNNPGMIDKLVDDEKFYSKIKQEFLFEKSIRSLSPRLLVKYDREPFLGKFNTNLRVTFDNNIQAIENDNLFYDGSGFQNVSSGLTVMEIKFTGSLPSYIGDIIQRWGLERVAFSKYCNGIDSCGSVNKLVSSPIYLLNNNLDLISNFKQSKIWKIF